MIINNVAITGTKSKLAVAFINLDMKLVDANSAFYQSCATSRDIKINQEIVCIENSEKAEEINGYIRRILNLKSESEEILELVTNTRPIEVKLLDADGNPSYCLTLKPCPGRTTHANFFIPGPLIRIELRAYRRLTICWGRVKERYQLTAAELSVLELVNQGLPRHAIAKERNTSAETVKSQMKGLKRKLNAKSQIEMIRNIRSHSYFFEDV